MVPFSQVMIPSRPSDVKIGSIFPQNKDKYKQMFENTT